MKTIAILDTETTSLDPATGHVVELALGLWSVEHRSLVRCRSWLISAPAEEVEKTRHVHGIPGALVASCGVPFEHVAEMVHAIVSKEATAILAYNAAFDRAWMPYAVQNVAPWVCACDDIAWPKASASKSLLAVAHAHGVQIGTLHRATDDVLLVARLLERSAELGHDIDAMLAKAMRPKVLVEVAERGFDEARNALCKAHAFRWDAPTKSWRRSIARDDLASLPFRVVEVAP